MCQNLNIFQVSKTLRFHSTPLEAQQSLLLLTQGNIYNRLRLNKYLMFLEELSDIFGENWLKFQTAGYLFFESTSRLPGI